MVYQGLSQSRQGFTLHSGQRSRRLFAGCNASMVWRLLHRAERSSCSTGAAETCIASHRYVPAPNLSCHVVLPLILFSTDSALLFGQCSLSHWRTGALYRGDCPVPITRTFTHFVFRNQRTPALPCDTGRTLTDSWGTSYDLTLLGSGIDYAIQPGNGDILRPHQILGSSRMRMQSLIVSPVQSCGLS